LQTQLVQQQKALINIFPKRPTAVITLLPWDITLSGIPNISWSRLSEFLEHSIERLRTLPKEYSSGYIALASEMLARIRSHPNKIVEHIVSPNNSFHRTHPRAPRFARRPAVRR
ncbi:MAG: hypothetical protein ACRD4B_02990, partial [Acidobacteriota bacterium]